MDARREVIQAAEARARALASQDSEGLRRLLHESFRWVTHTGVTLHRDDYINRNTKGTVPWRSQELSEVSVTLVGDTAVLHAEVADTIDSSDATVTFRMPMTQVWVRVDQRWRCLAGHAGPRRPQD